MHEGKQAELRMSKMILDAGFFDESVYECEIITYKPEEERIYLLSKSEELLSYSLDGIYECQIKNENDISQCSGIVIERYWSKLGKVLTLQIKNGFYKKVLN